MIKILYDKKRHWMISLEIMLIWRKKVGQGHGLGDLHSLEVSLRRN